MGIKKEGKITLTITLTYYERKENKKRKKSKNREEGKMRGVGKREIRKETKKGSE